MALILLLAGMLSFADLARRATLVAVAGLVFGWGPGAAGAAPATAPTVTTRAEVGSAGVALKARLLQQGEWGRGLAVMAAGDATDSPLTVVLGLETEGAVAGPVSGTGAWRELAAPHGHDAGSTVFHEGTGLRLRSGLDSGSLRGVQLQPTAGFAVAGFRRLAGAGGADAPPTLGLVTSLAPRSSLQVEAYAALRTETRREQPPAWVLEAAPFPGGVLALAGARLGLSAAGAGVWASANVSGGPRVPAGGHARVAARGDLGFGELRTVISVAGREFRDLTGASVAAPLAWALRFQGTAGPSEWKLKYRVGARGEELAPAWPAPRGESAPRELALAVTPTLQVGAWTLSATGKVEVAVAGPTLSAGARLASERGSLAVNWRDGSRGSLRVRGAVTAAAVTAEAGLTAAGAAATAELGIGLRTPEFTLRAGVRKLGVAPPAAPTVSVTFTAPA